MNNWQTKKLGEICDFFTDGNWIESKDQSSNGMRLIQTGNIGQGFFKDRGEKARYISEKTFKRLKCTEIFKGDILISRLPDPVGRACILPETGEKMITAVDCSILRLNKKISPNFLNYYTQSNAYLSEVEQKTTGTTKKRISRKNLGLVKIPLPPLSEQQRLVKMLDEVFEKIAKAKENTEKNLQNAKELFESYLQSVFANPGEDWEKTTIGKICNLMTGGTPSRTKKEYFKDGEINWLVSGDINKKEIKDCDGRITELGLKNSNAKYLPINSVMIALNGQGKTRGTVAMLRIKATCNQSLVSIYPKDDFKLLPELIYANLEGRYNELRKLTGDTGNDRRGLNMSIIRNTKFSFPKSVTEQKSIVLKLDALSTETKKLEAIYKQKLADLEELKKSVLKKVFNGDLQQSV